VQEFLQRLFDRLIGEESADEGLSAGEKDARDALLAQAIEHVVDKVSSRFKGLSGYQSRLRQPVTRALNHIDAMVDRVPTGFLCSRSTFVNDRRVNAFFVSPKHLSEVFSASKEVRQLFADQPLVDECWGLLCMHLERRQHLGMDVIGSALVKDVKLQVVNFTDHQIVSPGISEKDARKALKCCIFNNLLEYAQARIVQARNQQDGLWSQPPCDASTDADGISCDEDGQDERLHRGPMTLEDHFEHLLHILSNPEEFLRLRKAAIHIDRMGVVRDDDDPRGGSDPLELTEIDVSGKASRVGALVIFRRDELLPAKDQMRNAEIFLAM
jgi:hypothetical protein